MKTGRLPSIHWLIALCFLTSYFLKSHELPLKSQEQQKQDFEI